MQHIGLWHPKGGVGKTMLALNVAAALSKRGKTVVLVDLDPQRSAKWISQISGGFAFEVFSGYPSRQPDADFIITDHPPRLEDVPPGGVIVAPVRPVAHEVAALMAAIRTLSAEQGHDLRPLVNFYDPRRADHTGNIDAVPELAGVPRIRNRSIYERAINRGVSIFDPSIDNLSGVRAARAEILLTVDYLLA